MRVFALAVAFVCSLAAEDAREIVRKSLDLDEAQLKLSRQYTFVERVESRDLDDKGAVKKREAKTYDVLNLEGTYYERLIARDDKPLSPKEEREEEEKFERSLEKRTRETSAQRSKRIAEEERKRKEQLDELRQIVDAFDLTITGEEVVSGRNAWVIEAKPRPGFRGRGRLAQMFPKLEGRLWVCKDDFRWVKAEAETLDTLSLGWVVARVHKGTRFAFENMRVNDEIWLPKAITGTYSGRLALLKRLHGEFDITFRNYRKFQSDSKVVDVSEAGQPAVENR